MRYDCILRLMTFQTSLEEIFSHYSNYDLIGLEVIQGVPQKQFFSL